MSNEWLLFIFFVVGIILAGDVTRRAMYAIIHARDEQMVRMRMRYLRKPDQPWVTVLVYENDQAMALEKTVRHIRRSRYTAFDIVVVSERSKGETVRRMKKYIEASRGVERIQFLQRRNVGTRMDAYRAAYRKSKHGKIIVCLEAGDEVDPLFIKRAVVMQTTQQQWNVTARINKKEIYGLQAITKSLQELFWNHSKNIGVYTSSALRSSKKALSHSYSGYIVVGIQPTVLIGVGLSILYSGFIALWYAWVLCSLYLFALIWVNTTTSNSEKWKVSFSVPSALFLIPTVALVEGAVQLRIRK